jgi:hypothetical protein
VFPDATVEATQIDKYPIEVTLSYEGETIVTVPQNQLFAKNGWPAEKTITKELTDFKSKLQL